MAVRPVRIYGDPVLRQRTREVTTFDESLRQLIADMYDTMKVYNGVGLAANQIGVSQRVLVVDVPIDDERHDRFALVNPVLSPVGKEMEDGWEGCLSVPGMRGIVPRYERLHYTGFDQYGKPIDRLVSGFHARVVQHECDHLDGILYPMRIRDLATFGFTDVLFPGMDLQDD